MHKEAELSFFSIKKQRTSYGNTSSIQLCKAPKHSLFSPKYKACKLIYVVLPFLPSHACSRGAPSLLHKIVRCPQPMIFFLKKRDANWLCPRHGIHGEQGRDIGLAGTPKRRRAGGVYWWRRQLGEFHLFSRRSFELACSLVGASSWRWRLSGICRATAVVRVAPKMNHREKVSSLRAAREQRWLEAPAKEQHHRETRLSCRRRQYTPRARHRLGVPASPMSLPCSPCMLWCGHIIN
jgi:hypothetical protein